MLTSPRASASILLALSLLLIAAAHPLPHDYWQEPSATHPSAPAHGWSELEKDMRPEACAQCHYNQFQAWRESLHAQAYSDGMLGQFPGMGHAAANRCLSCHAPLQEQRYRNDEDMMDSLRLKLRHPQGPRAEDWLEAEPKLPLRHSGVSCAACHVRGYRRFGPPRAGSEKTGHIRTDVHGGFRATKEFESSQFCAICHQFPQSQAVNGKPLENTLREWQQSRFAEDNITCQQCHMPFRRHEFKGIHDPSMVRKGLRIEAGIDAQGKARIRLHSTWIGHAFPTYVTPKVVVTAIALDPQGKELQRWQWNIARTVEYRQGQWVELHDTRIMPGEIRRYAVENPPPGSQRIRFSVRVIPDAFYRDVYRTLLRTHDDTIAESLLQRAEARTHTREFLLFDQTVQLAPKSAS